MALKNLSVIRRKLLRWYDQHRRDLPWRRTRDPYAIWIAETMLQQTQVATVAPYYERFLRELPTVHALDRAPLSRILALWSGLGYYRRAENLKKSAREIVRKYGGHLPDDCDALIACLVSATNAGAMSIAFQKSYPAIDGNAHRSCTASSPKNDRSCGKRLRLVPRSRPGYFNQGLMELGATIVFPKIHCPRCACAHCPTRDGSTQRPCEQKSGLIRDIEWPLAILRQDRKVLLRQRMAKDSGRFIGISGLKGPQARACDSRWRPNCGIGGNPERRIGEFRHSITNRKIRSPVYSSIP
jgi:A/G-specific adenine glycosylase